MMNRIRLAAALAALGAVPDAVFVDEAATMRRPRPRVRVIDPPERYRDTRCPESSMRPPEPLPVRDVQALSAAEAKRARKALKRAQEMHPPSKCCPDCGHTYCTCKP